MLHDWGVILTAFGYIGLLFFVAHYGDRLSPALLLYAITRRDSSVRARSLRHRTAEARVRL